MPLDQATRKKIESESLRRSFSVERSSVNEEDRTVELAFSSEEPYERWFGVEVLSHDPQAVKLNRLNGGGAVLVNHDTRDQVGVVVSARVDSDKRGRATVKFSRSTRGQEIFQDIQDGIRTLVSVGYSIIKYSVEERKGEADHVTVMEWEPHEISIVPIPADATVGVGRSQEPNIPQKVKKMEPETIVAPTVDAAAERSKLRTEETRRIDAIRSVAGQYDGMEDLARQAIEAGTAEGDFYKDVMTELGKRNVKLREQETAAPEVDLSKRDASKFSLVRLMDALGDRNDRAAQSRAAFELEVCGAAAAALPSDYNVRGVFVPGSLMRDLSVGSDGDLVGTEHRAGSFIELLRANMTLMQAGATMLPGLVGNVDIPRQTGGASATWISAEDSDATESEPTFDSITLTPKDLAVYTEVTRRLRQQSSPAIDGLLMRDLSMAIALGMDYAGYYGSGSAGQPQGINGATGVDDPTISSATAPTYAELVTIIADLMRANAASGLTWVGSPEFWADMLTTPKQGSGVEGNFISDGTSILGRPLLVSSQLVANDFMVGDFSQILIGEWGGYELNVDPYTHSLKGKTRYVVFKTCDIQIRQPSKFSFHDAA